MKTTAIEQLNEMERTDYIEAIRKKFLEDINNLERDNIEFITQQNPLNIWNTIDIVCVGIELASLLQLKQYIESSDFLTQEHRGIPIFSDADLDYILNAPFERFMAQVAFDVADNAKEALKEARSFNIPSFDDHTLKYNFQIIDTFNRHLYFKRKEDDQKEIIHEKEY